MRRPEQRWMGRIRAGAAAWVLSAGAYGQTGYFAPLGVLPATNPGSMLLGVSADGQTAAGTVRSGLFPNELGLPCRWTLGGLEARARPAWSPVSATNWAQPAAGPNATGAIVLNAYRFCEVSSTQGAEAGPVVWAGELLYQLATAGTAGSCRGMLVHAVSADGRVLAGEGTYLRTSPPIMQVSGAVLWIDGALVSLEEFAHSTALRDLEVAAVRSEGPTLYGTLNESPVRWSPAGGLVSLPLPAGATPPARLNSVSADGEVYFAFAHDGTPGRWRAFTHSATRGAEWLPLLGNGDWLVPATMAGDASAFVCEAIRPAGSDFVGAGYYLWRPGSEPVAIETVLRETGLHFPGWTNLTVRSLSDDGRVLGGNGIDPCGRAQGWVARIPDSPRCAADFNGSGVVSVQDIFDFLAGYFAGSEASDWNGSCSLSVQDIFDFLAAYFAACP